MHGKFNCITVIVFLLTLIGHNTVFMGYRFHYDTFRTIMNSSFMGLCYHNIFPPPKWQITPPPTPHHPTSPPPKNPPMHIPCTTHARPSLPSNQCHAPTPCSTHARPGLPVDQNPNLTPPNQGAFELHDTAASRCFVWAEIHRASNFVFFQ